MTATNSALYVANHNSTLLCARLTVMRPSNFCQVRATSLSRQRHDQCRFTWSHWCAISSQCRVTRNFTFFLRHFFVM